MIKIMPDLQNGIRILVTHFSTVKYKPVLQVLYYNKHIQQKQN